jgi:aspartate aminotransferase-like enzyme
MVEEEFLVTAGPTEIPLRVLRAQLRPSIGPGDPEFVEIMDETTEMLQELFQTKNNAFFFPGSGRVTIESAILSVVEPGDKVLALVNGVFGKWMRQTAERAGAQVIEVATHWRKAFQPSQVAEVLDRETDVKMVMIVHNETSTAVRNPVPEVGELVRKSGSLFLVDSVSSLGGDDVKTDEWSIDLNCTGCYKCINSPPGLSIVSVSERAWQVMEKRSRPAATFSYDLLKWKHMWLPREKGGKLVWGYRRHPIEPAPHLTYALNEALKVIIQDGLHKRIARNRLAGEAIRSGCKAMSLELYPLSEDDASNTLTGIVNPEGLDNAEILELMRKRYGVVAGGGLEETAGKIIRLAHMSMTSREMYVTRSMFALGSALKALGRGVDPSLGVDAVKEVFADHPSERA